MTKSKESDENWSTILDNICSKLNIDIDAAENARKSFCEIHKNYTLDGDPQHWLACALYVACTTSITPTLEIGKVLEGNCVSLTRLLRLCNISLIQFFNKIKKWMEMATLTMDIRDKITRLEKTFAVSTLIFKKFKPMFQDIFRGLTNEPVNVKNNIKSKKQRLQPCTTNALFEFTWCLYVCVKGEFHNSADDLVDMYHILLSCIDFVFANAFMARRIDLINTSFKGLPKDWLQDDYVLPECVPCIIPKLCEMKDGLVVEAATMREYSWRPVIKSFFEKGYLKGDSEQLTGVLDIGDFDDNLKSVNTLYETFVLSVGEFDERIFLGEHATEPTGTRKVSGEEISQVIAAFGPNSSTSPATPLTGVRYLPHSEPLTPVSEATQSRTRLAAYLHNASPHPSAKILRLFAECGISEETITKYVIEPCKAWSEQLLQALVDRPYNKEARCTMVTCLYYKVLEHIIREELHKKPQLSLQVLLTQETYQLTMYACCTEVVLHAYTVNSLRFPLVLRVFKLSAFDFYKIIELVVQALYDKLSRDAIKHLNAVEEQVLEALVWTSDSPLWERLATTPVPASAGVYIQESPYRRGTGMQSPVSSTERVFTASADQARRQLFNEVIRPGQSLLVGSNVNSATEGARAQTSQETSADAMSSTTPPRRVNHSLTLFFRKFYSLAVVRMNHLCSRLSLHDDELKRKIWTCLEYAIMHETALMRDRHLDQILMCSVYVICKVSNSAINPVERTFAEIMRCYRQSPLADNHVYRSVLIRRGGAGEEPERDDLINFYNKVYVQCMQNFALRFTGRNRNELSLSPLPCGRGEASFSPGGQRVSARHHLYVKALADAADAAEACSAAHPLTYRFSRSPAKNLHAINTMVACEVGGKRARIGGVGVSSGGPSSSVARKLHDLMSDRQAV